MDDSSSYSGLGQVAVGDAVLKLKRSFIFSFLIVILPAIFIMTSFLGLSEYISENGEATTN